MCDDAVKSFLSDFPIFIFAVVFSLFIFPFFDFFLFFVLFESEEGVVVFGASLFFKSEVLDLSF